MDAEQKSTLAWLQKLQTEAAKAREPFEQDWWLNAAFFLGHQYVRWGTHNQLEEVPRHARERHAPRPVANKIMHFAMQSHAAAMEHDPRPELLPVSSDSSDRSVARVGQAYLDELTGPTQIDWSAVRSAATLWAIICGTGWIKWMYSPTHKRPTAEPVSPFDVYVDPFASEWREARYVIHSKFMDQEAVYDHYGIEVKDEGVENVDALRTKILGSMGYAPTMSGVTVNELWMRPNRRHPEGAYAAWTDKGRLLVHKRANPYRHRRLPFSMLGVVPVPGLPYHHAATKFLRPGQMELNKYHAQKLMIRQAFANPKWFIDSTLRANMEELPDDSPNQILVGDSMGGQLKPEILQPSAMADTQDGQWIVAEMEDTVGLHAVSQGDAPGRVDSARALELLRNEDLSRLAVLNKLVDSAIADGFYQILMLAKQYVAEEVIATTYTRQGTPEVRRFKASDLPDNTRLRVISAQGLPRTQGARREHILALWNARIITDGRRVAELLDLPYSGSASDTEQDLTQATNENLLMADGVYIEPNEWDNHPAHIAEHNAWRKTPDYDAATDDVRQTFDHHVEAHEDAELAEAKKIAERQAAVAAIGREAVAGTGGPPPPEGASVDPAPPPPQDPGEQDLPPLAE